MAIKVKSADAVAKKWGEVTPGRSSFYESGTAGASEDWARNASAAAASYKAGISAANIEQRFKGGIARAGAAKYARKVKDVGVSRFAAGVSAGVADMQAGIAPMLETIAGLTLSARAPRGSESNLARVREISTALNKKRMALRAASA